MLYLERPYNEILNVPMLCRRGASDTALGLPSTNLLMVGRDYF